jgi:tetratricopeptide (TPR) repeat protein
MFNFNVLSYLLTASLCVLPSTPAHATSIADSALQPVNADLTLGKADDAIARLSLSLAANPGDAKAAKPHGPALVDAAALLTRTHREPQLAIELLKLYLASPNQSADAPAFQVRIQLSRLLEQQGDHGGAQQQIEAAAELARDYHPKAPKAASL